MSQKIKASGFSQLLNFFASPYAKIPERIYQPDLEVYDSVKDENSLRKASVLLAVTRHTESFNSHVVLTVRSANLKSHPGQISLPGGTQEEKDIDPVATALRESQEEIGLKADQVEIIGSLGVLALPSGFLVKPVVGLIDPGLSYTPQPEEVADIFHIPLDLVLDESAYKKAQVEFKGASRTILELQFEDYRVWGATAAILYHLATEISKFCE